MKRIFSRVSGQISVLIALIVLSCFLTSFAISRAIWPKRTVFATYVNLVVLNILVMDKQTEQPVQDLRAEDFEVFDNGEPTRIAIFRQGPRFDEEPVVLWLIAGCGQKRKRVKQRDGHADAADFLKSALGHLNPEDMVGVAHLCAEKDIARVDLEPTSDRAAPAIALNSVMRQNSVESREQDGGQVAQKVLQLIYAATPASEQSRYLVAVFLDSDISNESKAETAQFAGDLLAHTSLVVAGIDEGAVSASKLSSAGRIPMLHYLSQETGGQIISTKGKTVAEALEEIVIGLHSRYELAYVPPARVEGWHALSVKLSATAVEKHEGAILSFRSGYRLASWSDLHPVSESPVDNGRGFDGAVTHALESDTPIGDIAFEADGATYEGSALNAQFSVKLEGEGLHWRSQSDSYDRSEITIVTAYFSAQGEILQKELKHYEVARRKEDAWTVRKQSFHFFLLSDIPAKADRIRIVIRDDDSGKMGFRDLLVEKVLSAPRIRAVIAENSLAETPTTHWAQQAAPLQRRD
jgi:VWFA-related protein